MMEHLGWLSVFVGCNLCSWAEDVGQNAMIDLQVKKYSVLAEDVGQNAMIDLQVKNYSVLQVGGAHI